MTLLDSARKYFGEILHDYLYGNTIDFDFTDKSGNSKSDVASGFSYVLNSVSDNSYVAKFSYENTLDKDGWSITGLTIAGNLYSVTAKEIEGGYDYDIQITFVISSYNTD